MRDGDVLILRGHEILSVLAGRETDLIETVRKAYQAHSRGNSCLPHSTFLRFSDEPEKRIIALPAYLGGEFGVAGIKWVASFPGNRNLGLDRASAVVILNSPLTGRPEAVLEGSVISAKRTAASAALAAQCLQQVTQLRSLGLVGCGLINFEITQFLLAVYPSLEQLILYDIDNSRARQFQSSCLSRFSGIQVTVVNHLSAVLSGSSLISLATTALNPHIFDLSGCSRGCLILHISLRDLSPEVILGCHNIVDDVDHVCRAHTSIHLAEQLVGNRDFISCTLGDILNGTGREMNPTHDVSVFSPFGLGILDVAVSKMVLELTSQRGLGTEIECFLPEPWAANVRADTPATTQTRRRDG